MLKCPNVLQITLSKPSENKPGPILLGILTSLLFSFSYIFSNLTLNSVTKNHHVFNQVDEKKLASPIIIIKSYISKMMIKIYFDDVRIV